MRGKRMALQDYFVTILLPDKIEKPVNIDAYKLLV